MRGKNKIYFVVIALGLAALCLDRFYFGATSPSTTSAAETRAEDDEADTRPARRPAVPTASGKAPTGVPELHFPRNLPPFEASSELRDLFARPGDAPNTRKTDRAHLGSADPGQPEAIGHEQFAGTHALGALMMMDGLKIAVVNGHWLRVGDILDTCTLIRIDGDSAGFSCCDGEADLSTAPGRSRAKG